MLKLSCWCSAARRIVPTVAACNYSSQSYIEQKTADDRPSLQEDVTSIVGKHLVNLKNLSRDELRQLLWTSTDLKIRIKEEGEVLQPLVGKTVGMIFQTNCARMRLAVESGMSALGGKAVFLGSEDLCLGEDEPIKDTAKSVSSLVDCVLARLNIQADMEEFAMESAVPVISSGSDLYRPLQTLADMLTLWEKFGYLRGLKIAWVGEGNNILHSLMIACPKLGIDLNIATPKTYECGPEVLQLAAKFTATHKTRLHLTNDPREAVQKADAIVTSRWLSPGMKDTEERLEAFHGFQVNRKLHSQAAPGCVFMHSLPRCREEVTDDIFYDVKHSLVWQQVENSRWIVMSAILHLLTDHLPATPRIKIGRLDE